MITTQSVTCPNCGANLDVQEGRKELFCSYCGSKVTVKDDSEQVVRHIDEADVIRAQTEREIALHQMKTGQAEMTKLQKEKKQTALILKYLKIFFIVLSAVSFIIIGSGSESSSQTWAAVFTASIIGWIVVARKIKKHNYK